MQGGRHHHTLEEIGRLEAERRVLDDRIRALRMTLPKPETEKAIKRTGLSPAQSEPLVVLNSAPEKAKATITDHAVLRYLERVHGFNFESVRFALLSKLEHGR